MLYYFDDTIQKFYVPLLTDKSVVCLSAPLSVGLVCMSACVLGCVCFEIIRALPIAQFA